MSTQAGQTLAIEAKAAEWIAQRSDAERWSDNEQAMLDAWLAESSLHEVAYLRLLALWESADRLAILRKPMREASEGASMGGNWRVMRITAALVLMVAGTSAYFYEHNPKDRTYSTPLGGSETVLLADGSRIELNTSTVLRTDITASRRKVTLVRGEAYFQIKHDAAHPFTVETGGHRIIDLGTKFLVKSNTDRVEVSLIEGKAQFDFSDTRTQAHPAILTPGDVAVATSSALSVTRKSSDAISNELGWRRGVLIFDRTTLADVADEVNRYSTKKLIVADPQAARLTIGGTFPTRSVRTIAEAAQDFYGLHFEDRGGEIVISR
jgi:transmembrane sensor